MSPVFPCAQKLDRNILLKRNSSFGDWLQFRESTPLKLEKFLHFRVLSQEKRKESMVTLCARPGSCLGYLWGKLSEFLEIFPATLLKAVIQRLLRRSLSCFAWSRNNFIKWNSCHILTEHYCADKYSVGYWGKTGTKSFIFVARKNYFKYISVVQIVMVGGIFSVVKLFFNPEFSWFWFKYFFTINR